MNPPMVYDVTSPRTHKTIKIRKIVQSILLLAFKNFRTDGTVTAKRNQMVDSFGGKTLGNQVCLRSLVEFVRRGRVPTR